VLLRADAAGLTLAGADSERAVRLACEATVHTDGGAAVPVAPLAETLRMLNTSPCGSPSRAHGSPCAWTALGSHCRCWSRPDTPG
jgi:hypothetical protein